MPTIVLRTNHFLGKKSVSDSLKFLGETVNGKKFEIPSAITAVKFYRIEQLLSTHSREFFVLFPYLFLLLYLFPLL